MLFLTNDMFEKNLNSSVYVIPDQARNDVARDFLRVYQPSELLYLHVLQG
jgi:hypothetical protein